MKKFLEKVVKIAKEINSAGGYKIIDVPPDDTYMKCPYCDGTGFDDMFLNIECHHCDGTSIIKKTYKVPHR